MLALPQLGIMFNDNANQAVAWIRDMKNSAKIHANQAAASQKDCLVLMRLPPFLASSFLSCLSVKNL